MAARVKREGVRAGVASMDEVYEQMERVIAERAAGRLSETGFMERIEALFDSLSPEVKAHILERAFLRGQM